jgi:hypothetical protein
MRLCGTEVQGCKKYEVKKFSGAKEKRGLGRKGSELNDLAQNWAFLSAVFGL